MSKHTVTIFDYKNDRAQYGAAPDKVEIFETLEEAKNFALQENFLPQNIWRRQIIIEDEEGNYIDGDWVKEDIEMIKEANNE